MEHTSWNLMLRMFIYWLLLVLYWGVIHAGFEELHPCVDAAGYDNTKGIIWLILLPFVFTVVFRFLFITDKRFRINYFARSFLFVVLAIPVSFVWGAITIPGVEYCIREVVSYSRLWDYFFYRPCDGSGVILRPWVIYSSLSFLNPFLLTVAILIKPIRDFLRIEYRT